MQAAISVFENLLDRIRPSALRFALLLCVGLPFLGQSSQDEVEEIVFAVRQQNYDGHWYANFGYYADSAERVAYRAGGGLRKLNLASGEITHLFDDPEGSIRDPQVHYDGRTIVFSYRPAGEEHYHLFEIQSDGRGLRQLTDGPYDDIEPAYLPDDSIVFVSARCRRWVNCWLTQVAVLYRCERDGSQIRQLSANIEHDNTPWPLPDGRILYQRWEYIDRSQVHYHHLWTMNPDGTGQMVYYGNLHPGTVMIDAKPIPGTEDVLAVFSPGHGQKEHAGAITIVSPKQGPDHTASALRITQGDNFRDPYPLGGGQFLVARETQLLRVNREGEETELYRLPRAEQDKGVWLHEPRPLVVRVRERTIPGRVDPNKKSGTLVVADVYNGRQMGGVEEGRITKLLVMESLPKPINYTGGMDPLSFGGTFTLPRILGTVPVEADGSAAFEVPALRSLFLIALDDQNNSVKRMQSFLSVMPGEVSSCVGCHEHRTRTPELGGQARLAALARAPSQIEPLPNIPDVYDFPRDVQPILDRHCVKCHNPMKRKGGIVLTGDHGPMFSLSYYELTIQHQFVDGRDDPKSNLPPGAIGAPPSPLMAKLGGSHHKVKLAPEEIERIRFWIEASAPYPGTYAALGSGMIGGYAENSQVATDFEWAESVAAGKAIEQRCAGCHTGDLVLPRNLSDERGVSFWRPDFHDPRLKLSRHRVYNLSRPARSMMLLAPLAKSAGGYGICRLPTQEAGEEGRPVFADTTDADYLKILEMCERGRQRLSEIKRFDMRGFLPPPPYVREMQRYGVLPADFTQGRDTMDVYAMDRAYWDRVAGVNGALEGAR